MHTLLIIVVVLAVWFVASALLAVFVGKVIALGSRRLVMVGACVAVSAAPVAAQERIAPAYTVMVAGNVADLLTTQQAFTRGSHEGNGITSTDQIVPLALSKACTVVAIGMSMRLLERHGHPRIAKVIGWLDGGVTAAAAMHNYRVAR